jgi:type I restriction enzyme S subunit
MNSSLESAVKELESGRRPKGGVNANTGTIPSLGGEHLDKDGGFRLGKLKFIDENFYNSLKKGHIHKNDILIVKDGATTGKISFVNSNFPFEKAAINEHLFILRVDLSVAVPYYVFQMLKSPQGQIQILKDFRGAAIGGISRGFIKRAKIPLPVLNDQIRIAHLLERVEILIAQRKAQLKQLDKLLESVFFNMFGDPVGNKKQWNKDPLGKLLSRVDSGWSPKCESVSANNDQWAVLKLGAISSGIFKQEENKAMLPNVEPKIQHEVKAGDLLFTRKNTYDLVASTAFVHGTRSKLLLPDLIFRLVIKDHNKIHPIYLWKLLSFPSQRKTIQSLANGAAGSMPNISKANLKEALVPVPEIEQQLKFVEVVNKIEKVKTSLKSTLRDLNQLYGSLNQKAFKGELDLSAVPLPEKSDEITELSDNESTEINKLQKKLERISKPLKRFEKITKSFEQIERISKPLKQFEQITKSFEQVERITKPLKHLDQITKSFEQVERITKPLKHLDQITKSFEQVERITKPLKRLDQITKSFESLILPKALPDFSKEKTRKKWLIKLLKEFLTDLHQNSFLSLPDFLEAAQNWIGEFEQEDGERLSFLIDDYEALKCWVFNEVRNGTILQVYQEASNSIQFKVSQ